MQLANGVSPRNKNDHEEAKVTPSPFSPLSAPKLCQVSWEDVVGAAAFMLTSNLAKASELALKASALQHEPH